MNKKLSGSGARWKKSKKEKPSLVPSVTDEMRTCCILVYVCAFYFLRACSPVIRKEKLTPSNVEKKGNKFSYGLLLFSNVSKGRRGL